MRPPHPSDSGEEVELNKPNADTFAMGAFPRAGSRRVRALRRPFRRAPDFGVTGATGEIAGRFTRGEEPA